MRYKGKAHVRWNDIDAFGHINNANYLTYVQESRADFTWWSRVRAGEKPILMDMVVARAEVDYLEPIYEGGFDIDVEIWVTKIGNSSFDLAYQLSSKGTIHANAKTVQVAVSMETKKSRPLSDIEREYLGRYLAS
jgi:acyl-CoA thioester hydrolase